MSPETPWTSFTAYFFLYLMEKCFTRHQREVCEERTGVYLSASYNIGVFRILSARKRSQTHEEKVHLENVKFEFFKVGFGDQKCILYHLLESAEARGIEALKEGKEWRSYSPDLFSLHPGMLDFWVVL